jgi:hypothetical protein
VPSGEPAAKAGGMLDKLTGEPIPVPAAVSATAAAASSRAAAPRRQDP